jgi:carbamoylphosphate synthase large subunit
MKKKLAFMLCLIGGTLGAVNVEFIQPEDTFEKDKALYLKAYSYYYKDLADKLAVENLDEELEKRFNSEETLIKEKKEGLHAIRAKEGDDHVAYLLILDQKEQCVLQLIRLAIDPYSNIEVVVKAILDFVKESFPHAQYINTMARRGSEVEIELFTKLGFQEFNPLVHRYFRNSLKAPPQPKE